MGKAEILKPPCKFYKKHSAVMLMEILLYILLEDIVSIFDNTV